MQTTADSLLVIVGGTLIDGSGGTPIRDVQIHIANGRIQAVVKRGQPYPADATVVQAEGKYIIPGLIDTHMHWEGWMGEILLLHGTTAVLDTGALFPMDWMIAQKEGIARRKILAPRFHLCGPILRGGATKRQGDTWYPVIDSPETGQRVMAELVAQGMDAIKCYSGLTWDSMRAICDAAHAAGLPTLGHINMDAVMASQCGLDCLAHASGILEAGVKPEDRPKMEALKIRTLETQDPFWFARHVYIDSERLKSVIEALVAAETYIQPTFFHNAGGVLDPNHDRWLLEDFRFCQNPAVRYIPEPFKAEVLGFGRSFGFDRLTPDEWATATKGEAVMHRAVRDFVAAGGKVITASGLSHVVPGISLHREMEILVHNAGLTPMQALLGATRYAAEWLRRADDMGTVTPGKQADLVILDADPLTDIRNTQRIHQVIFSGEALEMCYHPWHANPIPQPPHTYLYGHFRPAIAAISPQVVREREETELLVEGSWFTPNTVVRMGDQDLPTRFIDETRVSARLSAEATRNVGTYPVVVHKPQPTEHGGTSDPIYFIVKYQ
jgi:hypothetical protein